VVVEGVEGAAFVGMRYDRVGGNGILFSNHVTHSLIADSEFLYPGDSAVVFLGSTNGIDGSAPTYPDQNTVARNHMHENGLFGKQSSCFAQQLSANSTILDNVCYNGPRAGFNQSE